MKINFILILIFGFFVKNDKGKDEFFSLQRIVVENHKVVSIKVFSKDDEEKVRHFAKISEDSIKLWLNKKSNIKINPSKYIIYTVFMTDSTHLTSICNNPILDLDKFFIWTDIVQSEQNEDITFSFNWWSDNFKNEKVKIFPNPQRPMNND